MNIKRPTLIINEDIVQANIKRVAEKFQSIGISFRPHFKTHHAHKVGQWYRAAGVNKITVSSVSMAAYFAEDGWDDITIAFPYNPLEYEDIDELAANIELNILIESEEALTHAQTHLKNPIHYFIEIDTGQHRTGIAPHQTELISRLINASNKKCIFKGLLTHAGHSYGARSRDEISQTHQAALDRIQQLKKDIDRQDIYVSYGDTPSASISTDFEGIEELRPGNLVYYDLMQAQIGSCEEQQIGVALACPVVSIHLERNEMVVYGGAVHLSKDRIEIGGNAVFGKAVRFTEKGWEILEESYMVRISQEHGVISMPEQILGTFKIGDLIGILPVHSCLMADLMTAQMTLNGEVITKMNKI